MSFHNIRQTKTYRFIYKLLELLFLTLVGIYLFYRVARITTFGLVFPTDFEGNLLIVMTVVAVLRLFSTPLRRWKTLAALGFALVYCLVYRSDGYRFLLFLAVMTVGLIDIDYRKILRVYVASVGIITSCAVFAGVIGAITNLVYTGIGRGLRSAWGIAYPTDFAKLFFYIAGAVDSGGEVPGLGDAVSVRSICYDSQVHRIQHKQHRLWRCFYACHTVLYV